VELPYDMASQYHEGLSLKEVLGDYESFIDQVCDRLRAAGLDVVARGYEMDHICYRCETISHYQSVMAALVPAFGTLLVEGMIGGRPISTVRLQNPIVHNGIIVTCIEVPCPKPNRPYPPGLEHAELVIGSKEDGLLVRWTPACWQSNFCKGDRRKYLEHWTGKLEYVYKTIVDDFRRNRKRCLKKASANS